MIELKNVTKNIRAKQPLKMFLSSFRAEKSSACSGKTVPAKQLL